MNRKAGFPDETRNRHPFPQRIAIVTAAWLPQMNGVVRTLTTTCPSSSLAAAVGSRRGRRSATPRRPP